MLQPPPRRQLTAALLSAAIVALVAHAVTLLLFFVGRSFDPSVLPVANGFFGFGTLAAFVVLAIAARLGAFRSRLWALVAGVVAAVVASLAGTTLGAAIAGSEVSGPLLTAVLGTLVGVNLIFLVALVGTTVALGPLLYRSIADAPPAVLRSGRTALVRLPAGNLADGTVTHIERVPVDAALADEQWAAYVDAFRGAGWEVVEVPAAEGMADSVFVEDLVVVAGGIAVLTRPGSEHRRGESAGVEGTIRSLGLPIARIEEPGTLDGGDVLLVGDTAYVGRGGRTNAEGIRQLRALLQPRGITVVAVPVSKVLHLKTAVTALPDGTVLGHPDSIDDPRLFPRFLEVPEASGTNLVVLDPETVLIPASAPRTAELVRSLGYRVVPLELSEFEKLEAGVTCLSVRIRGRQQAAART